MTRERRRLLLAAIGAPLAAAGCALVAGIFGGGPPVFSHAEHAEKGAECKDCHGGAPDKDRPVFPAMSVCMDCHKDLDDKKPPERRAMAFVPEGKTEPEWTRVTALSGEVIFDHAKHVQRGAACAECHAGIDKSARVTADLAVSMEACVACHAKKATASNDCAVCHRERRRDESPPSHRGLWAQEHGAVSRGAAGHTEAARCSLCHTERNCSECHQQQSPRDHNAAWRLRTHGYAAALDRSRCQVCHQTSSCDQCHREASPRSHVGAWGGATSNHCYTCHASATDQSCAVCHRGASSHALAAPKPATHLPGMNCRQCHTPAAPGVQKLTHADNGMECNACHK